MYLAWKLIQEEYTEYIEQIQSVGPLECNCYDDSSDSSENWHTLPDHCPLHNREHGFFGVLRRRLAQQIKANWEDAKLAPFPLVCVTAEEILPFVERKWSG